ARQPGGHAGRPIASSFGEGFFGTSYFRDPIPETSICSRCALGLERTAKAERWVHEGRMTGGNRREKLGRSAFRAAQSRIYRGEGGEKGGFREKGDESRNSHYQNSTIYKAREDTDIGHRTNRNDSWMSNATPSDGTRPLGGPYCLVANLCLHQDR